MSKYGNKKTVIDNIQFASKAEAARYRELKLLEAAGEISQLVLQPKFEIIPKFTAQNGKKIRATTYIADFSYYELASGNVVVEDVKGVRTKEYAVKSKMFQYLNADIDFREIVGRSN